MLISRLWIFGIRTAKIKPNQYE